MKFRNINMIGKLKFKTKAFDSVSQRFLYLGRNSGIHGIKYVFEERGTIFSRTLWLLTLLIFTGCLYLLLKPVVERGNSVSFTPDTRYLNWTTTFPSVTVCETYSPKIVLRKMSEEYSDLLEPLNYDFKRYISDLVFGRGVCSRSLCLPCGKPVPCDVPWRDIVENIHKRCNELIGDCNFNGKDFSCCKYFHVVDSEYGPCYSFNSLQGKYTEETQFVVNRITAPGFLSFRLLYDAQVTIHSTEELSTNVLDKKFKIDVNTNLEKRVDFFFSTIEVDNDDLLKYEDIPVRKCRYKSEIPNESLHTYKVYSYGACLLARKTYKSFERCGCVHPVRDFSYKDLYCNYTGLNCLVTYEVLKTKLGEAVTEVDDKDCLPSCDESEISNVHVSKKWIDDQETGTRVNMRMAYLPSLRYQKKLLRTHLDLVVTVGGIVGLFFSASILSCVEVFYLILKTPNK